MELFPTLEIGWLNGWILLAIEFLIQGFLLLIFPKDVVARLFDRSGWSVKQRVYLITGKVFSLITLVLIILTPLKIQLKYLHPWADSVWAWRSWSGPGDVQLQRYTTGSAGDQGALQDITPPPNCGASHLLTGDMYGDRLMGGFIHATDFQNIAAFQYSCRGRGMFETIW